MRVKINTKYVVNIDAGYGRNAFDEHLGKYLVLDVLGVQTGQRSIRSSHHRLRKGP